MAAIPSFIELMASLGLDGDSKSSSRLGISPARSRSGSCSSTSSSSSIKDQSPTSPTFNISFDSSRDLDNDRHHCCNRLKAARYTPYISSEILGKQHGMGAPVVSEEDEDKEPKVQSTSPPSCSPRRRPSPLRFSKTGKDEHASTPISSYLRRKTPQNSPTVSTFTNRDPVERPEAITLPSLFSL
ncbi:hypothetical protein F5141DRAFT_1216492 [Pisolithus sp. B1]|nr:hypothetical protein F5141DRAFT_1216492 [Pisolithus sp. B1]